MVTGLAAVPASAAGSESVGAATTSSVVAERPDAVTAQMAARAQGSRVEVAGERSESRRVWANPDGSFTAEVYAGPNWVQDAQGRWTEIDTMKRPGFFAAPMRVAVLG
jgi:hypothetical protein